MNKHTAAPPTNSATSKNGEKKEEEEDSTNLIRTRIAFLSRSGKGSSKSVRVPPTCSVPDLVLKALSVFRIRQDTTIPEGGFTEVSYHGQLIGGLDGGVVWAADTTADVIGIRANCGPRIRVFDALGLQLLIMLDEPIRWEVKKPMALALRHDKTKLIPWEKMGLLPLSPEGILLRDSVSTTVKRQWGKPATPSVKASAKRKSRRLGSGYTSSSSTSDEDEEDEDVDYEVDEEYEGPQDDNNSIWTSSATATRARSRRRTSAPELTVQSSTDGEDVTTEGSTVSAAEQTPTRSRSARKRTRLDAEIAELEKSTQDEAPNIVDVKPDNSEAKKNAEEPAVAEQQEAKQEVKPVTETPPPEPSEEPTISFKVRLTFSGSEKMMHAQKKMELPPDMNPMELVLTALEFCKFETLPIRPKGSFIEVVHGNTLLGGMDADGRVWALPEPVGQLELSPTNISTICTHVHNTRGARLKANFYGSGWNEVASADPCLSKPPEPSPQRTRRSPADVEAKSSQQAQPEQATPAVADEDASVPAEPVADVARTESPAPKAKRRRGSGATPVPELTATPRKSPTPEEVSAPATSSSSPSSTAPLKQATQTSTGTASAGKRRPGNVAQDKNTTDTSAGVNAQVLDVLRESYGHLSDKYLDLLERHQQMLHDFAALDEWKSLANQPCVVCSEPIRGPSNAAVFAGCGHTAIHSSCAAGSNKRSLPRTCPICDKPVASIVPLSVVP